MAQGLLDEQAIGLEGLEDLTPSPVFGHLDDFGDGPGLRRGLGMSQCEAGNGDRGSLSGVKRQRNAPIHRCRVLRDDARLSYGR